MIQTKSIRKRLDNVVKALNVDKDMFYWAFCSVFTRSFAGDQKADCTIPEWFKQPEGSTDFPLNAPLVDLANHGTNMKLLCWSGLNKKNGSMYLRTHKPIKKGTELCISYGLGEYKIIKWGACSRWSLSLYCSKRNSDQMTIRKTRTTLAMCLHQCVIPLH